MRSRTLTKTLAITPSTYERIAQLKAQLRLRTYDDVISYLLGDFQSPPLRVQNEENLPVSPLL
jgi:hypothetical protein